MKLEMTVSSIDKSMRLEGLVVVPWKRASSRANADLVELLFRWTIEHCDKDPAALCNDWITMSTPSMPIPLPGNISGMKGNRLPCAPSTTRVIPFDLQSFPIAVTSAVNPS